MPLSGKTAVVTGAGQGLGTVAMAGAGAIVYGGVATPPFLAYLAAASDEQKNSLYQLILLGRLGTPRNTRRWPSTSRARTTTSPDRSSAPTAEP
ncbi:hypothetical protein [Nocardia sp. NPDC051463]|uniref:hypothetical protein n=1 Tax=Nocardia sp. NPDC051463 TaxID=3154845 RepID=UPI00341BFC89